MSEPEKYMAKDKILESIEQEHHNMEALLATMDEKQLVERGVYDELSVKDVLVHIIAWERMMLGWLEASLRGETPVVWASGYNFESEDSDSVMNGLNERIFDENKDKPLADVLADFRFAHIEVLEAVSVVSEEDLNDPERFAWRKGRPFWWAIGGNTFWHYQEHIELIKAWMDNSR